MGLMGYFRPIAIIHCIGRKAKQVNPKTTIAVSLGILAILFVGIAILTHQPDTIIVITIPAWLRAAGASTLFGLSIFWLRSHLWHIAPVMDRLGDWLEDDSAPRLTDQLDRPATDHTTRLTVVDSDWYHKSGVR